MTVILMIVVSSRDEDRRTWSQRDLIFGVLLMRPPPAAKELVDSMIGVVQEAVTSGLSL